MVQRDESEKLLVIGGPFDRQRMARKGDEFTEEIGSKKSRFYGKFTYNLRWHPLLKALVWALPQNKSVTAPSDGICEYCGGDGYHAVPCTPGVDCEPCKGTGKRRSA
ncbi:hypothetical protein [Pseudomonas sp. R9.37]|uniref:hypothetical protein n=1 Tax=Pseudomonas sp. R9.37 TaxID=1390498 RepID=UPI000D0D8740|nr:hypothetical protein [Pseudomonas sp. R9.37]PSL90769.1 hypothetical protein C7U57_28545 [Pseudomonas sp. R9.37]